MTIPIVFYYHRLNCYSFNALAGALDADPSLADLPVDIALDAEQLHTLVASRISRHNRAAAALSIMTCQFPEMHVVIRRLRLDFGTRVSILAGGPHTTARPHDVLAAGADVVFRGEAEVNFPEVIRRMAAGLDFENVQTPSRRVNLDSFSSFLRKECLPDQIAGACLRLAIADYAFSGRAPASGIGTSFAGGSPFRQSEGRAPAFPECLFLWLVRWMPTQLRRNPRLALGAALDTAAQK
jgi:hypothetical protein